MNVLITGAQFSNKGAQSLLFTVMDQLRKKYDDVNIFYLPLDKVESYPSETYRFKLVFDDCSYKDANGKLACIKKYMRITGKKLLRRSVFKEKNVSMLSAVWKDIDLMIDVSGYQLGSKWNYRTNRYYLRHIAQAKAHNIPVILMPQSFGPFDYNKDDSILNDMIKNLLGKTDLIFARETQGAELLQGKYGISKNVIVTPDTVLQGDEVDINNIYIHEPKLNFRSIETTGNVGIVPNQQTNVHGDSSTNMEIYRKIINYLLSNGKHVYIFRHSGDFQMCEMIYEMFRNEDRVTLIRDEMNCIEYSSFVRQFDYIICSRYHAVVHAYKVSVPVLILGWSIKYMELARHFGQERYVFDITHVNTDSAEKIEQALAELNELASDESRKLLACFGQICNNSCFEHCWEFIDSHIIR